VFLRSRALTLDGPTYCLGGLSKTDLEQIKKASEEPRVRSAPPACAANLLSSFSSRFFKDNRERHKLLGLGVSAHCPRALPSLPRKRGRRILLVLYPGRHSLRSLGFPSPPRDGFPKRDARFAKRGALGYFPLAPPGQNAELRAGARDQGQCRDAPLVLMSRFFKLTVRSRSDRLKVIRFHNSFKL
jgi:hypothetical protein